ncbi:hypothetical protein GCM10022200_09050 [Microbacterium awajiense]|uniref:Uncharacterized protein n=1 Tax=Microbacterium awajiense TaxID=415214 RepID=A0ABP7ABJ1_9MICO
MHDALAAIAWAADAPAPTPTPAVDPNLVTPGPWGFAVIVFLALAVILLIGDMLRRIRRGRVRADIAEELDDEERAADGHAAEGEEGGRSPASDAADGDEAATPPRET